MIYNKTPCITVPHNNVSGQIGRFDYSKENRCYNPDVFKKMSLIRLQGSIVLSFLTTIASGQWYIAGFQSGYSETS
tara:strand:+ start:1921 stop:2148 length:228 start_codon:yes stop_codon:yes gene_type:complete